MIDVEAMSNNVNNCNNRTKRCAYSLSSKQQPVPPYQ